MLETIKRVNQQTAAVNNRQLVIHLLLEHGQLSRSQLVKLTDLRGSTLTYITRELLGMKMLKQAGQRESTTVGQKQQLLQIDPAYGWVIGIDMRLGESQVVILDAKGQLVGDCLLNTDKDLSKLKRSLPKLIEKSAQQYDLSPDKLLGIGLGMPGIVDVQTGTVIRSDLFAMCDYDMAEELTQALSIPVRVDHDANLIALAEQQQGSARGLRDFIVVIMDDEQVEDKIGYRSFGTALVLNGQVHRGSQFAAGELDQRLMPTINAIGTQADMQLLAQEDAPLSEWLSHVSEQSSLTLASLVNLLDPQAVLLAGDRPIANQNFLDDLASRINGMRIGHLPQPLQVHNCAFSTQSCARGAALAARDVTLAGAVANYVR
ncbi:MAG TPA: hypothetical protein DER01_13590 [Phycisphaerales bacterium]|nr:hypothetical protein [Phycisphaerales bacterium]